MSEKLVLGVSCYFHDAAAALVRGGHVIAAAEEERFSRIKHDSNFPRHAISFVLEQACVAPKDISAVAFFEDPGLRFFRVLRQYFFSKQGRAHAAEVFKTWKDKKLWIRETLSDYLGLPKSKVFFLKHHESHIAAAYGTCLENKGGFLTLDGVGENCAGIIGAFDDSKSRVTSTLDFPHSLGLLYSAMTEFLGFEVNEGEFKVMGMAAYGEPIYREKIELLFKYRSDNGFELDMSFFAFQHSLTTNISPKFNTLFGPSRLPESQFLPANSNRQDWRINFPGRYYADIAASLQAVVEDQILNMAKHATIESGTKNLLYGGGVAYNSAANGKILKQLKLDRLHIFPACGDSGSAVGAALALTGGRAELHNAYLGRAYSDSEVRDALRRAGLHWKTYIDEQILVKSVATLLSTGAVGAMCRGRFEFGPRALGNRSIIANPRDELMQHKVNLSIKYREIFRPFAPVVPANRATEFFDLEPSETHKSIYKWMLGVTNVRQEARESLGAVTHVNGTARVQVLERDVNPFMYDLLVYFGELTGIPILLNTSFNLRGEPMVASPIDAIKTFKLSRLDFLLINNCLVTR